MQVLHLVRHHDLESDDVVFRGLALITFVILYARRHALYCLWQADFEVESLFVPTTGCGRILGAATVEAVCSGRGLLCGQIGCLEKSGGGTALVHHMVHYARNLRCSFLVASPLDKDAAGFWRAAGLKALRQLGSVIR